MTSQELFFLYFYQISSTYISEKMYTGQVALYVLMSALQSGHFFYFSPLKTINWNAGECQNPADLYTRR